MYCCITAFQDLVETLLAVFHIAGLGVLKFLQYLIYNCVLFQDFKIDNSNLKYKLCTNVDCVYLAMMLYVMCSLHCRFKADFVGLLLCDLRWISDWQDPTVLLESTLFLEF